MKTPEPKHNHCLNDCSDTPLLSQARQERIVCSTENCDSTANLVYTFCIKHGFECLQEKIDQAYKRGKLHGGEIKLKVITDLEKKARAETAEEILKMVKDIGNQAYNINVSQRKEFAEGVNNMVWHLSEQIKNKYLTER